MEEFTSCDWKEDCGVHHYCKICKRYTYTDIKYGTCIYKEDTLCEGCLEVLESINDNAKER